MLRLTHVECEKLWQCTCVNFCAINREFEMSGNTLKWQFIMLMQSKKFKAENVKNSSKENFINAGKFNLFHVSSSGTELFVNFFSLHFFVLFWMAMSSMSVCRLVAYSVEITNNFFDILSVSNQWFWILRETRFGSMLKIDDVGEAFG